MGRSRLPAHIRALLPQEADSRPRAISMLLTLPFPPSLNNLYPTVLVNGKPRRVKSTACKRYEAAVRQIVALWQSRHQMLPPSPPYALYLRVYPPQDRARHDLTNLFKAPEDAVMASIGGEDNDVVWVNGQKMPKGPCPRVEFSLETAQALGLETDHE